MILAVMPTAVPGEKFFEDILADDKDPAADGDGSIHSKDDMVDKDGSVFSTLSDSLSSDIYGCRILSEGEDDMSLSG